MSTTLTPAPAAEQGEKPHRVQSGLLDPKLIVASLPDAVKKLDPRVMVKNPVMFVVEIGSVLTTILSMTFGFSFVQFLAFGVYVIAALAFMQLSKRSKRVKPASTVAPPESSFDPPPTMEPVAT